MFGRSRRVEPSERAPKSRKDHQHAPGLDGVRGVAVAAIVAYHLGLMDGGLLSVSVFFTLSGYLITSILLAGWRKTGTIDLKTFWLRRARRLLPALFFLLPVVLFAAAIARPNKLAMYGRQAFAAAFYMANWATIARGDTYFNRFSGPGPLDHLWSLAIEEQFYAIWPVLLLLLLIAAQKLSGRRRGSGISSRAAMAVMVVTGLLATASAFAMAWRYVPNAINNTRAYEGTDGRAAPILIGTLTAMFAPLDRIGELGRRSRIVLDVIGVICCVVVVKLVISTDEYSPFLYRGGETVVSIASALLVLACAHPKTIVGKAFGIAPLQWLGERTYGIYLWHMPIVAFMPSAMLEGRPVMRVALQLGLTLALAGLSWTLLEDPIRRNGVIATFTNIGAKKSPGRIVFRRWAGAMALVPVSIAALAAWPLLSHAKASEVDFEALTAELTAEPPDPRPAPAGSVVAVSVTKEALLTSCTQLVHVGDSTSLGLASKRYIPLAEDRLDARYRAVGVEMFVPEIAGGRAIVEKYKDIPSAYEVVSWKAGYKGCWVFALGIGDSANIRGNVQGLSQRIDWMMARADGAPVLWTNTKTLLDKGPYANVFMNGWHQALVQACGRYPNMRVYDWANEAQDGWYLPDKIHPNEIGSKERAARIAKALAVAFPKDRAPSAECVVRSTL